GILIGRGAIGNPWIFRQCHQLFHEEPCGGREGSVLACLPETEQGGRSQQLFEVPVAERVDVCRRHLKMSVDFKGERTAIFEMRKHYGSYFKGLYNFKPYRLALVATTTLADTERVLDQIKEHYLGA
ncbi:MAG: tRNA-dihydrouridine synthase, partial [Bacteroidales bacterium]|nr:tRNA-dihydrouridine synthase [Bacteroidales bacterium]